MFFIEMLPKVHSCNIVPNVSIRSLRSSALTITEGIDPGFIAVGVDFSCSSQTIPHSLIIFDTRPQATLGSFETKMAACKGWWWILTILPKNRGLWTVEIILNKSSTKRENYLTLLTSICFVILIVEFHSLSSDKYLKPCLMLIG